MHDTETPNPHSIEAADAGSDHAPSHAPDGRGAARLGLENASGRSGDPVSTADRISAHYSPNRAKIIAKRLRRILLERFECAVRRHVVYDAITSGFGFDRTDLAFRTDPGPRRWSTTRASERLLEKAPGLEPNDARAAIAAIAPIPEPSDGGDFGDARVPSTGRDPAAAAAWGAADHPPRPPAQDAFRSQIAAARHRGPASKPQVAILRHEPKAFRQAASRHRPVRDGANVRRPVLTVRTDEYTREVVGFNPS